MDVQMVVTVLTLPNHLSSALLEPIKKRTECIVMKQYLALMWQRDAIKTKLVNLTIMGAQMVTTVPALTHSQLCVLLEPTRKKIDIIAMNQHLALKFPLDVIKTKKDSLNILVVQLAIVATVMKLCLVLLVILAPPLSTVVPITTATRGTRVLGVIK